MPLADLPQLDSLALLHQQAVQTHIENVITAAGGAIPFSQFMQLALYAPGLGYYNNGSHKLGQGGDFTTAPELSPLFSRTLARQCQQVLNNLSNGEILEFGAGSGVMAADILLELEHLNCLPQRYLILDVSADLRQRQQQTLTTRCPHLLPTVTWLDYLPQTFTGIMLANEVMDAMPVHKFQLSVERVAEYYVKFEQNQFCWQLQAPSSIALTEKIAELALEPIVDYPYTSELNLNLDAWISSLAATLQQGIIILIDYGFPQREYYHPQRDQGTLMCHYQQRAHTDPLILTGLQDITAHVDFTTVANQAINNHLEVTGYTSQAAFLLGCGIHELATSTDIQQQWLDSNAIKKLTLPSEMGELFKVMALAKNFDLPLLGFSWQDRRGQL